MSQSVSITPYELTNILRDMRDSQRSIIDQLSVERNWSDEQYRIFNETYMVMHNQVFPHVEVQYEHIIRFLESGIHMAEEYERIKMNR